MVYKRYIKKDGRIYGPYIYHSKKEKGKVISSYLGRSEGSANKKNFLKRYLLLGVAGLFLIFLFLFIKDNLTGKVVLDINSLYSSSGNLEGNMQLFLEKEELIPASTKVSIKLEDSSYEYFLSELVSEEIVNGDFYVKGKSISGEGKGYDGVRIKYPAVSFVLDIFFKKEIEKQEAETQGGGSAKISEDKKVEEVEEPKKIEEPEKEEKETKDEEKSKEKEPEKEVSKEETTTTIGKTTEKEKSKGSGKVIKSVEEKVTESNSKPENSEESSVTKKVVGELFEKTSNLLLGITGQAISGTRIEGEVSADKPFVYELSEGQTANLVSSSQKVKLNIRDNKAVVTTDYTEISRGEITLDLGKLNIPVKEGEVIITLIYNGEEIASVSKRIVLEKSIEQDLTENITTFDEITGVNVTIETIQYGAVLNSPVKWKKNIKLTQLANVSVELPRQAENITIYKIIRGESGISSDSEDQAGEKLESPSVEDKTISKADSSISSEEGVSETDKQGIKEKEQIKKREKVKSEIELEVTVETGGIFSRTFNFVTGRIIEIIEKEEVKEVFIDENVTEFEIEYNTPAPVAFEKNVSGGKLITISSKVHYKNVLVYTKLPEPVPENNVKLYNYENGSKVLVNFKGYSIAENNTGVATKNEDNQTSENKIELNVTSGEGSDLPSATGRVVEELTPSAPSETDVTNPENEFFVSSNQSKGEQNATRVISYIEWIVPYLSNQTYQLVTEISKAEHLDENRIFISDIYEKVKSLDGNWSEIIDDREYVQVTFELPLGSMRNITLYARAVNSSKVSNIEVYLENGNKTIALIENISEENLYKTYLTNLTGNETYYVFDLRVLGAVEIDYIIDPVSIGNKFVIQNSLGDDVASVSEKGELYLREYVYVEQEFLNPGANSFIIQNSSKDVISYFNSTGSLFLLGTVTPNSNLSGLTSTNLEFRNSSDDLIAFFDNTGNLKLKGGIYENFDAP